jgi:hypothetical protein
MPEENVHITHCISGGGPIEPRETFLREFEPWLGELSSDDIAEVKTVSEYIGTPPGTLKTVRRTKTKNYIDAMLQAFMKVTLKDIPREGAEVEGGSAYSVEFILNDGTIKTVKLNGGIYRYGYEQEELSVLCYFELSEIPSLPSETDVLESYSFTTYSEDSTLYSHIDGEEVELGTLGSLSELEFEALDYNGQFNIDKYVYTLKADIGVLFIFDDKHFALGQDTPDVGKCYILTNIGFNDFLGAYNLIK